MDLQVIYILFWIYSFLGWCMETLLVSLKSKKYINRGFFLGPYCPIYGTGGILLLSLNNYQDAPLIVFILAIFICSIVEYLTSYFLELVYKVRWWDYSNRMFNINGRVCLFNSICFGLLGTIMVSFLNPFFLNLITSLKDSFKYILLGIIFSVTTIDMIVTFTTMFDIRKTVINLKEKTLTSLFRPNSDNTEEISKKVRSIVREKGFIHKHLTKAYSNFLINRDHFFKRSEELSKIKLKEKLENSYVIGAFISILIGLILGKIFGNISIFIIISFVLGIIIIHLINRSSNGK